MNLPAEKNRRILIVDDNHAIHDDFRKILSPPTAAAAALDATEVELFGQPAKAAPQIRYEIDSAYQGADSVLLVEKALAEGRPYAMAFVDIRMPPGMDGVETTQKIWAVDPEVQIVLCTAYSDYSWDEMFEKIGNSDGLVILKKPFDTVEALQLAQAFTEKWWLHQQTRRKMDELESMVAARTSELQLTADALQQQKVELRLLFDMTPAMIWFKDTENNIVRINQRVADAVGKPVAEIEGKSVLEIYPYAQEAAKYYADDLEVIHSRKPKFGIVETLRDPDGKIIWIETDKVPVCDKDGKVVGVVVMAQDITERKRSEEALRESEERFSGAFEFAPIGMALVAPEGRWLKVNRALCDLVGYSETDLLARTFQDITHPDDLAPDLEFVRQLLAGEIGSYQLEKRYVHQRGNFVTVLLNVSLVRDDQGQPRYFISQIQDITESKRASTALLESKRFLRSTLDALSSHIAILDEHGTIIEVNAAWKNFALENNFIGSNRSVGDNYLKVCDSAAGNYSKEAPAVAAGIRAIIGGQQEEFSLEYPCHSPREKRWFIVRATRFAGDGPVRVVVAHENITERRLAESLVRQSEERYRSLIDNARDAIFTIGADGNFTSLNPAVEVISGASRADWLGKPFAAMVHPDDLPLATEMFQHVMHGEPAAIHELRGNPSLKRPALMEMTLTAQKDDNGKIIGLLGIGRDITARKKLEAQLFQSQKMETVGKLAGGIAHEFNSILTAIIGQSELLLGDLPAGSPLVQNVAEISKAANRAATLTRQLLAYGRKQFLQPEILDLNRVVASMDGMFQHLMGSEVETHIVSAADLHTVKADVGQIEQVIMNLVINARDAMPNGGKLTLETANVSFDPDSVGRYPELKPGDYVMLAITDTGTGMSAEVKARMFEPFFSTKGVGKGTGLGLSTCYGIIKQSGGHISVYSELGRGSTFKIYLPQVEAQAKISVPHLASPDLPSGTETILLVEDDPALREMAATLLRRLGYTVFAAGNGVEALSVQHERSTGHIDLLFTDVVMPHMSGRELADRVGALYPDTKILFTSAYTENAIIQQGVLDKNVALLQKPFTPSAMALKVREVLDQSVAPKPDAAQETFGFTKNSGEKKTLANGS